MTYFDLVDLHQAQLGKVADRFPDFDAAAERHLAGAARRLSQKRPRECIGTLTLTAGVTEYPAPTGMFGLPISEWGMGAQRLFYAADFIGVPPLLARVESGGISVLRLSYPPTAQQIAIWGGTLTYRYWQAHSLTLYSVTVADADQPLVLLAAMIEAMRELSADTTIVQFQKGLTGLPTAGTPAYLYEKLLLEFESA